MKAKMAMLFLSLASCNAWAGPPFLTDDPEPVEYLHHELILAAMQFKTAEGTTGTLPHILTPMAFSSPAAGAYRYGYGDTELGVKIRILQENQDTPMVGIYPTVEVPTGDRNTGNGKPQYFLPLWMQKTWGSWQSYGGGYWMNSASGQENHWFFGWLLQKELSERLTFGGELFRQTALVPGQGSSTGFNLGGSYNFDETNHLLYSAGRGIANVAQTDQRTLYIGYQRTW
jgi:hypothetical protein